MPPYGLISLVDRPFGITDITRGVNIPEELAAEGYRNINAFSPGLDSDFRQSLYQYDPAFGQLNATQRYQPAPYTGARPFQAMFDISPTYFEGTNISQLPYDIPSYGGVSGYRDTGGIMGIEPVRYSADFDTSYGVANEEDEEQVEYLPGQEPQGIAKLIQKIGDIYSSLPTPMNILRGGLESLQGFNQRIRNTDFGRSKTLAEYFDRRSRAKNAARMAERAADFSERTAGAGATGGDRDFSTPAGKSTSYEEASRAFGTGR